MEILPQKDNAYRVLPQKKRPCGLLASVKIDSKDTKRVSLKLRTHEGTSAILQVLIIPYGEPTSVALEVPLKPLNLHERVSSIDAVSYPCSVIKVSGKFSISDALQWVSNCVQDAPTNIEKQIELFYKSALLGTFLSVTVEESAVTVKSDNLSVMAIMKEQLVSNASRRKIKVHVEEQELDFSSLDHVINILCPLLDAQYEVA